MVHAQPQAQPQSQAQHEAGCILPSLSNVLHAMRASKHEDVVQEQAQSASAVWTQMQQLSSQHANMWGAPGFSGLSSYSQSSGRSGGDSASSSSPNSPGERVDEKPAPPVHTAPLVDLARCQQEPEAGKAPVAEKRDRHVETTSVVPPSSGLQYWPGRKWRERRDKKYGGEEISRQSEHLKVAVMGLQKALPTSDAKGALVSAIRHYLDGEMLPERFAEIIKSLVDDHNIIVPTGTLNPAADVNSRKRAHEQEALTSPRSRAADARRPGRVRQGKRAKNSCSPSGGGGAAGASVGKSSVQEGAGEEGNVNGAWEALVSVCSML